MKQSDLNRFDIGNLFGGPDSGNRGLCVEFSFVSKREPIFLLIFERPSKSEGLKLDKMLTTQRSNT